MPFQQPWPYDDDMPGPEGLISKVRLRAKTDMSQFLTQNGLRNSETRRHMIAMKSLMENCHMIALKNLMRTLLIMGLTWGEQTYACSEGLCFLRTSNL